MKRVDILKMQLLNSRGRFFTAEWIGVSGTNLRINMKVTEVVGESDGKVYVTVFVPQTKSHYKLGIPVNAKGDCTYIASDKSKFQMTGQRAFSF
jgi:hypothetical protein